MSRLARRFLDQLTFLRQQMEQNQDEIHTSGAERLEHFGAIAVMLSLLHPREKDAHAPCSAVDAQQPKKVARIRYLSAADPARESARVEAIRLALRDLGYIEGQNIATEYRYTEGKVDRFPELAADLVRLKVIPSW